MFLHTISARYLNHYKIEIQFSDRRTGVADLGDHLKGKLFEPLQDPDFFRQFVVDAELGTIRWPNGADLAPEYLYFLAFHDVPELREQFQKWGYLPAKIAVNL